MASRLLKYAFLFVKLADNQKYTIFSQLEDLAGKSNISDFILNKIEKLNPSNLESIQSLKADFERIHGPKGRSPMPQYGSFVKLLDALIALADDISFDLENDNIEDDFSDEEVDDDISDLPSAVGYVEEHYKELSKYLKDLFNDITIDSFKQSGKTLQKYVQLLNDKLNYVNDLRTETKNINLARALTIIVPFIEQGLDSLNGGSSPSKGQALKRPTKAKKSIPVKETVEDDYFEKGGEQEVYDLDSALFFVKSFMPKAYNLFIDFRKKLDVDEFESAEMDSDNYTAFLGNRYIDELFSMQEDAESKKDQPYFSNAYDALEEIMEEMENNINEFSELEEVKDISRRVQSLIDTERVSLEGSSGGEDEYGQNVLTADSDSRSDVDRFLSIDESQRASLAHKNKIDLIKEKQSFYNDRWQQAMKEYPSFKQFVEFKEGVLKNFKYAKEKAARLKKSTKPLTDKEAKLVSMYDDYLLSFKGDDSVRSKYDPDGWRMERIDKFFQFKIAKGGNLKKKDNKIVVTELIPNLDKEKIVPKKMKEFIQTWQELKDENKSEKDYYYYLEMINKLSQAFTKFDVENKDKLLSFLEKFKDNNRMLQRYIDPTIKYWMSKSEFTSDNVPKSAPLETAPKLSSLDKRKIEYRNIAEKAGKPELIPGIESSQNMKELTAYYNKYLQIFDK